MTPLISIFNSAIRTEYWSELYDILSASNIDFEIVYAGYVNPNISLPPNFKFIYTDVGAAKAAHIAFSQTRGKYVMNMPDDIVPQKFFLDNMMRTMQQVDDNKTIVTSKLKRVTPQIQTPKGLGILPVMSMMKKDVFVYLGGIDKRFINVLWDYDIAFRLYYMHGSIIHSSEWVEESPNKKSERLIKKSISDYKLSCYLWPNCIEGQFCNLHKISTGRADKVDSYFI